VLPTGAAAVASVLASASIDASSAETAAAASVLASISIDVGNARF
jgi:hypothetical protein